MNRWPIAIILFFVILVGAFGYVIYLSQTNPDPIVPSYETDAR